MQSNYTNINQQGLQGGKVHGPSSQLVYQHEGTINRFIEVRCQESMILLISLGTQERYLSCKISYLLQPLFNSSSALSLLISLHFSSLKHTTLFMYWHYIEIKGCLISRAYVDFRKKKHC